MADIGAEGVSQSQEPPMTFLALLNGMSLRNGITPEIKLVNASGQSHDPSFTFRMSASGLTSTASGKSKKIAKHLAAKGLLEQLVIQPETEWMIPDYDLAGREPLEYLESLMPELTGQPVAPSALPEAAPGTAEGSAEVNNNENATTEQPASTQEDSSHVNPVGRVLELVAKNKWPQAAFELTATEGQGLDTIFVFECRVGGHVESGQGKTKKAAKKEAGQKMLNFLWSIPEGSPFPGKTAGAITDKPEDTKENGDVGNGACEDSSAVPVQYNLDRVVKMLPELDLSNETPSLYHLILLKRYCFEQSINLPKTSHAIQNEGNLTDDAIHCCTLALEAVTPVSVKGFGYDSYNAEFDAALNVLSLLQEVAV